MSEELKPCPFCGGEAVLKSNTLTVGSRHLAFAECSCSTCGTSKAGVSKAGHSGEDAEAMAVERWNHRIERTCHMTDMHWDNGQCTWGCVCSACDAHLEHEKGRYLSYCPNCGAKVVSE